MPPDCRTRRVRGQRGLLLTLLTLAWPAASAAQIGIMDLSRPPRQERSVQVRATLPMWVAMPQSARILTSDGLELQSLKNSAVTYENAKLGVLVGALRNSGPCGRNLSVRLQYTDHRWQPLGAPIENEARVSQVEPGAALPYRFRLRRNDEFTEPPSGYVVQVVEDDKPVAATLQWVARNRKVDTSACPATALVASAQATRRRSTLSGYRIDGSLTVQSGGPVRPDGIMLTALLLDEAGEVLEVVTGIPAARRHELPTGLIENGQTIGFTLSTGIPIGNAVATVQMFTELLPDAQVAGDSQGQPQR